MKHLKNNQKAFTVIELLIASTVFSVIILGACVAIIQMTRLYYKGIIIQQTQTAARNLTQSIVQGIQYEGGSVSGITINGDVSYFEIGESRYTYAKNKQQNGSGTDAINHAMWKGAKSVDVGDLSTPTNGKDMLANNMRITYLDVAEVGSTNAPGLYKINVTVAYGDSDLFDDPSAPTSCKGNIAGSQWCAFVSYNTFAYRRNK